MDTLNNQYNNPFSKKHYRGKYWTQQKIKEVIELFQIHKTVAGVVKVLHKPESSIRKILLANGIFPPTVHEFRKTHWPAYETLQKLETQQKIIEDYNNGYSATDIGKQYGVTSGTIRQIIRQHKAQRNLPKHVIKLEANKEQILTFFQQGSSIVDIAKMFNCSDSAVRSFLLKNTNYKVRKKAKNPIPIEDIDKVYELHHRHQMTMKQIGELYNCTFPCVSDFFDKHGISRRTKSESIRIKNHEESNLFKKLKNLRSRKSYILPSGKTIKVMGYEGAFLDFIFNNNLLCEHEIEYEVKSIQYSENQKTRRYIPDFYIPKHNLMIEIKSKYILKINGGIHNLLCKRKGVLDVGYDFCLVLDNNFDSFLNKLKTKTS